MKKTLKLCLLTIILTLFCFFPAFAGEGAVGHLDFFNRSGISGWFYESSQPEAAAQLTIRLTNAVTGSTVLEIPVTTSLSRPDLEARTGAGSTPGFYSDIDWDSLEGGLYTASILSKGKPVGNSLSFHTGSSDGQNGVLAGVSSVKSLGSFRITGYCSCRHCSGSWGRRTSSGTTATAQRTIAVDPRVIPMGSRLLINGQIYTAEDTGGGVKGKHIDIYCDTHAQAKSLPFQNAQVFLLN